LPGCIRAAPSTGRATRAPPPPPTPLIPGGFLDRFRRRRTQALPVRATGNARQHDSRRSAAAQTSPRWSWGRAVGQFHGPKGRWIWQCVCGDLSGIPRMRGANQTTANRFFPAPSRWAVAIDSRCGSADCPPPVTMVTRPVRRDVGESHETNPPAAHRPRHAGSHAAGPRIASSFPGAPASHRSG